MFNGELLEHYRNMTAEQKNEALNQILDMDVPPLDMVIAFYMVLKPQRAEAMALQLKERSTNHLGVPS